MSRTKLIAEFIEPMATLTIAGPHDASTGMSRLKKRKTKPEKNQHVTQTDPQGKETGPWQA